MSKIINEIGKKLSKTGQQALDKTKNFAEVSRLNIKLAEEEQQLEDLYANLGRMFYKVNKHKPELLYKEMFGAIGGSLQNVAAIQTQISGLKGNRACPQCGESCVDGASYCIRCGTGLNPVAPTEIVYKLCTNCGEVGQALDQTCAKCHKPL